MIHYLILQHPGHNRVYFNLAGELALAELKIATQKMDANCDKIEIIEIKGVRYISFKMDIEIKENDIEIISRLSFVFALFKVDKFGEESCLIPLAKIDYEYVDSKISSLLKYPGKTNELFTKMMINIALLSSKYDYRETIELLDPVAGKGTTLFEGIVNGFNVTGIEIDTKSTHASSVFFKNYLKAERFKHTTNTRQVFGKNKSEAIYINEFEFARNKEEFKSETTRKNLGVVTGNSQDASKYFKKEKFHIIVGDLPYGIAHGNTLDKRLSSVTRNPSELLNLCLPEWFQVLKKGGTVVVAWNSFIIPKRKLEEIFQAKGFEVFTESSYNDFEHLVDKSIKRDIIVAQKK